MTDGTGNGPLNGIRVIELAGIGPGPHACMMLGDLGADVLRVERPANDQHPPPADFVLRNRRRIVADLKSPENVDRVRALVALADVVVEGFRPGVAERLGLGPDECTKINPRVVYARMTGWGQTGPLSARAGHDINYISLTGALHAIGGAGHRPTVPLNLVGDYGGGSTFLVTGVLAALVERARSGRGQVLDIAIVDGVNVLINQILSLHRSGQWTVGRGQNTLDGGAPYYDTYECGDGRYLAVGALEPRFYAQLLEGLGLDGEQLPTQTDVTGWPILRARFTEVIKTRTREEWTALFAGTDACVTPVLDFAEAPEHPHLKARGVHVNVEGVSQASPAPRFSRTPAPIPTPPPSHPIAFEDVLAAWR